MKNKIPYNGIFPKDLPTKLMECGNALALEYGSDLSINISQEDSIFRGIILTIEFNVKGRAVHGFLKEGYNDLDQYVLKNLEGEDLKNLWNTCLLYKKDFRSPQSDLNNLLKMMFSDGIIGKFYWEWDGTPAVPANPRKPFSVIMENRDRNRSILFRISSPTKQGDIWLTLPFSKITHKVIEKIDGICKAINENKYERFSFNLTDKTSPNHFYFDSRSGEQLEHLSILLKDLIETL